MAKNGPLHGSGWALSSRESQNDDGQVQSMQTASRSLCGDAAVEASSNNDACETEADDLRPHDEDEYSAASTCAGGNGEDCALMVGPFSPMTAVIFILVVIAMRP